MATRSDTRPKALPPAARILLVDHTAQMGGGEVALLRLIRQLDRTRYEPRVMLFADGPLRQALLSAGVDVTVVPVASVVGNVRKEALGVAGLLDPRRLRAAGGFVRRLVRAIEQARPQIVHTNSLKSDVLAGAAARWLGVPTVWHVRDRIADDYLPPAAARAFRAAIAALPDFVIANSDATLRTLGRVARARPARTRVVHDGTPVDGLPPSTSVTDTMHSADATAPFVVGMVGRVTPWKGQHVFLDAAALVRRRFPHARFQLIGSSLFGEADYDRQLHERAARPDLAGSIDFLGFCPDVPDRLAALDVLVHASVTAEPFGQVVIEGMAAAKPVVATDGGGVLEIIADGDSGLLVPMGDAAAMATAVERLLSDPDLRRQLGRRGRERVLEAFTESNTARGVEAVYDHMLRRPTGPTGNAVAAVSPCVQVTA